MNDQEKLSIFIDDNKPEFNDLIWKFEALFNKLGVYYQSERIQIAFTGIVCYSMINSIQCDKKQKEQLLKNMLEKFK